MSEEIQIEVADSPAPEQAPTAEPVSEEIEAPENEQPTEQQTKTFTQEELDAIVGKRLAREQRKWEREQTRRVQEAPVGSSELPTPEQFNSIDEYADALATRKAEELLVKREADRQKTDLLEAYQDREEEARSKYEDFEQVAYNPKLPITSVMAETIQASDIGPDLAYYLGTNPREADRISRLSPFLQAKEIGKLEAKMSSAPVLKKTTSAPPPIAPISGRGTGAPTHDTTDPRSIKSMSTSEWIEAERQRQIRKWEAQRNR
ncbi:hypothetical protein UFOVP169_34 [uncultured Caudovirales phage]|jgi:hypothetical protein|uniref:Scaffolding protein n=1 Tax=uncultured Caudovirales phage TaxID=2100421 RepID=A0A6J7WBA7_9CAUD|nr:hypothetical protein UFOVP169_34 [uncultured Caudovirales phage]